jgi:hypothetical protein
MFGAMEFGIADHGQRAGREQAAQVAIALLTDTAELFPAPLECCLGTSPIHAEKSRPDRKAFGGHAGDQSGSQHGTNARDLIQPLARLIRSVPSHDPAVELQYPGLSICSWASRAARQARAT